MERTNFLDLYHYLPKHVQDILSDSDYERDYINAEGCSYQRCKKYTQLLQEEGWEADYDLSGELVELWPKNRFILRKSGIWVFYEDGIELGYANEVGLIKGIRENGWEIPYTIHGIVVTKGHNWFNDQELFCLSIPNDGLHYEASLEDAIEAILKM